MSEERERERESERERDREKRKITVTSLLKRANVRGTRELKTERER